MKRLILSGALLIAGAAFLAAQPTTAQPAAPAAPKGPSQEEVKALQAVQIAMQSGDADAAIKAADDVLTRFKDTQFKDTVLTWEASAYQQKRDWVHAGIFAEQAIDANPKNFQAALILADIYCKQTHEHDLDRDERLAKADKYVKMVLDLIAVAPKPNPNLPDQQWEDAKKGVAAEAHHDLALANMVRKNWGAAETEFKTAIELTPEPAYQVQLASTYISDNKFDEAIALCDKVLAIPNLHPQIAAAAKGLKDNATKSKAK